MTPASARDLAQWIAQNQPKLFAKLLAQAGASKAQLGDFMDALESFGTTVGSAVKDVGSFLVSPDGIKTVASLGTAYLSSQAQRDALQTQVRLAANNQPLAPIYTASNSSPAYSGAVYLQPNPTQPAVPFASNPNANATPMFAGLPMSYWLIGGGVVIVAFLLLRNR